MVPFAPWGRLLPGRIRDGTLKQGEEGMVKKGDEGPIKNSEEEGKRARYITKKENIDEESSDQGLALNIFDKIMSWARFVNVSRPFDDDPDEESSKKAEEMEELTTAQVKKSTNATLDAELEKEELLLEEPEGDTKPGEGMFVYREWDYRSRTYKENYSIGFESVAEELKGDFVKEVLKEKRGLIKEVKRKFESVTSSVRVEKRQFDGDSIDIDAAVEAMTDLKMGRQPDERLFTFHKRSERDISALFLVDLSMSTDTWVKEKRVIDHEKEALVVLCEAMQSLRERYAIYGFSGQTRKRCSFIKIKGLDESYGETVRRRIEGLIPYHYTRMGPALRHSTSILKCESSDVKLLFLLSDGKPNDLDSYEGKYGIEDTRMAIREAEREGIVPFCLTVDSQAGEYLPTLFGRGNYALLSGVERLATRLPELYARIVRQL
jgi:nitric oxide reductase NorD protein